MTASDNKPKTCRECLHAQYRKSGRGICTVDVNPLVPKAQTIVTLRHEPLDIARPWFDCPCFEPKPAPEEADNAGTS